MPTQTTAGRSLVTRRAASDIVRSATLGSCGVRFGPGGAPPAVVRVDLATVRSRDLADSGTDVA